MLPSSKLFNFQTNKIKLLRLNENWNEFKDDEEKVVRLKSRVWNEAESDEASLPYIDSEGKMSNDEDSILKLSLNDINSIKRLSIHYLGDLCVQMGIKPPINIFRKIDSFLDKDQLSIMIKAFYSLDAADVSFGYQGERLETIAANYNMTETKLMEICEKERFNVPFALDTILHISEEIRLCKLLECLQENERSLLQSFSIKDTFLSNDYLNDPYASDEQLKSLGKLFQPPSPEKSNSRVRFLKDVDDEYNSDFKDINDNNNENTDGKETFIWED